MQLERLSRLDSGTDEDRESDLELLTVRSRINTKNVSEAEAEHLKSLKRIKDALSRFDLSKNEVRVYLYLARFGAQKAQRIAEASASTGPRPIRSSAASRSRGWYYASSRDP